MSRYDDYLASEYHRRNMQVARACGANAAVDQALDRARSVKGTPKWMIAYLESAADRLPGLQHDLAAWRELAPDRDEFVAPAALAQTIDDPGDGWTWNERLGWIGPDGKPADPRRRG